MPTIESELNTSFCIEGHRKILQSVSRHAVEFQLAQPEELGQSLSRACIDYIKNKIPLSLLRGETQFDVAAYRRTFPSKERFYQYKKEFDRDSILKSANPDVAKLRKSIARCVKIYVKMYENEYQKNIPNEVHSWTIACKEYPAGEEPHFHHRNCLNLTGIYYVAGAFNKTNGGLKFFRNSEDLAGVRYEPEAGKLILFSSSLLHAPEFYCGPDLRICIPFDIWFQNKSERAFHKLV